MGWRENVDQYQHTVHPVQHGRLAGGGQVPALTRYNRKGATDNLLGAGLARPTDFDPNDQGATDAVTDAWVKRLIQRPVETDKQKILADVLSDGVNDDSLRKMVQLIVSMPEYQLC